MKRETGPYNDGEVKQTHTGLQRGVLKSHIGFLEKEDRIVPGRDRIGPYSDGGGCNPLSGPRLEEPESLESNRIAKLMQDDLS